MSEPAYKDPRANALAQKADEILELVDHILEAAPTGGQHARMLKPRIGHMHGDALMIPAKIAGAEGGDLYDIRMENTAIIRKCARDLIVGLRDWRSTATTSRSTSTYRARRWRSSANCSWSG